jgi:hypothetical protein
MHRALDIPRLIVPKVFCRELRRKKNTIPTIEFNVNHAVAYLPISGEHQRYAYNPVFLRKESLSGQQTVE